MREAFEPSTASTHYLGQAAGPMIIPPVKLIKTPISSEFIDHSDRFCSSPMPAGRYDSGEHGRLMSAFHPKLTLANGHSHSMFTNRSRAAIAGGCPHGATDRVRPLRQLADLGRIRCGACSAAASWPASPGDSNACCAATGKQKRTVLSPPAPRNQSLPARTGRASRSRSDTSRPAQLARAVGAPREIAPREDQAPPRDPEC